MRSLPPIGPLAALACLLAAFANGCSPPPDAGEASSTGSGPPPVRVEAPLPACEPVGSETSSTLAVDTIASGLEVPWDLAFLADGRILVTERPGRIRLVEGGALRDEPWATVAAASVAEAGLLGIAAAPDFDATGHVYVVATYQDVPDALVARWGWALLRRIIRTADPDRAVVWKNRIVRLRDEGGAGVDETSVVDGIPSGPIHAGGALRFDAEGRLVTGIGDGGYPDAAQDPASMRGKLLRYDPSGAAPGASVRSGPFLALGLRNPQGVAYDPVTGDLFAIDHGPTGLEREGGRRDDDELNRVMPGGNYGWPAVSGMWQGGGFEPPLVAWTPAIAPAGLALADAPGTAWHGDAFVSGLQSEAIHRLALARPGAEAETGAVENAPRVVCEERLFEGSYGRLRLVHWGPDGALYFGTSNRDQRGRPGPGDDLLLRVVPPPAPEP